MIARKIGDNSLGRGIVPEMAMLGGKIGDKSLGGGEGRKEKRYPGNELAGKLIWTRRRRAGLSEDA